MVIGIEHCALFSVAITSFDEKKKKRSEDDFTELFLMDTLLKAARQVSGVRLKCKRQERRRV
jgi:hypothetical protein